MQETRPDSSKQSMTVEQLIQLKRLEKPNSKFWDRFDHELKQKQLQALMRPSRWSRMRAAWARPHLAALAPLAAASVLVVALGWVTFWAFSGLGPDGHYGLDSDQPPVDSLVLAAQVAEVSGFFVDAETAPVTDAGAEAVAPRPADSRFVEVVLRPESPVSNQSSFITVADIETFTGAADSKAYYVVNAFTARPNAYGNQVTAFEF
jgi:hypothetical protein